MHRNRVEGTIVTRTSSTKGAPMRFALSFRLCAISPLFLAAAPALAATYDDNASDLSNNQASPTPFTLTLGANSIIGSVGGANIGGSNQDFIAITVPAGMQMTSYVDAAYSGADAQGFTGFQFGSSFVGGTGVPGSYAGYAHFGSGATNSGVSGGSPTTTVGVDLLSALHYMADNGAGGTAAGATGYTPPLGAGTYTFLIQQTNSNAAVSYEFDISVVPEPATLTLLSLGGTAMFLVTARRKNNPR